MMSAKDRLLVTDVQIDLTAADSDTLESEVQRLRGLKQLNADNMEFTATPSGKRWLDKRRKELVAVRKRYKRLNYDGEAEKVMRQLAIIQAQEEQIMAYLEEMDNTEKISDALDKSLKACHDRIRGRKESNAFAR